jgi:hypothetical protein
MSYEKYFAGVRAEVVQIMTQHWPAYLSDENCDRAAAFILKTLGVTAASKTGVGRAIADIPLERVDGLSMSEGIVAEEQKRLDVTLTEIDSMPMTNSLYERLISMSMSEVSDRYFSEPLFRRLYDRASAVWGFSKPQRRIARPAVVPQRLTVAEYHAMPVSEKIRKMKSEPAFVAAVNLLISAGQI